MNTIALYSALIFAVVSQGRGAMDLCNGAKTIWCCSMNPENEFIEPTDDICTEIRDCYDDIRIACSNEFFALRKHDRVFLRKKYFTDKYVTLYCIDVKVLNECLVDAAKTQCVSKTFPNGLSKYEVLGHFADMAFGNPGCDDLRNYMINT